MALGVALAVYTLATTAATAQTSVAELERLALSMPEMPEAVRLSCATPEIVARQRFYGFSPLDALRLVDPGASEDQPLWYDQNPRIVRADHSGGLSLDNLLITGDVASVFFERWSASREEAVQETWQRTRTDSMGGRLVSVFNPRWSSTELWNTIGSRLRGPDRPRVYFGKLTIPKRITTTDEEEDDGDDRTFHIWLTAAPLNVPTAEVRRIDGTTQYASHVVNLVIPDFGDRRIEEGKFGYDLAGAANRFYRYFRDDYDSIAFVPRQHPVAQYGAFHRNVRNPVGGLGIPVFDNATHYGSNGVLRSVELYQGGSFGRTETSTHEIGHQWVDYWNWSAMAGDIERAGHEPDAHTPLLFPGEVYTGAVLNVSRRVEVDDEAGYTIARTPAGARLHPTTLYRMGLLETAEVPEVRVFEDQGQFTDTDSSATPDTGTVVEGGDRGVHINDALAEHGVRTGPADRNWSRVTVVVSRNELLSAAEMSYWNWLAARHAATGDVTSWEGVPSFYEATGEQVRLRTGVTPRSHTRIRQTIDVAPSGVHREELRGILLDDPVPTRIGAGERIVVAGRVTAVDRTDFHAVCVRWLRYGATEDERIFECGSLNGDWFSIPYTFTTADAGNYALQAFLFWPESGAQYPRASVTGIRVEGDATANGDRSG